MKLKGKCAVLLAVLVLTGCEAVKESSSLNAFVSLTETDTQAETETVTGKIQETTLPQDNIIVEIRETSETTKASEPAETQQAAEAGGDIDEPVPKTEPVGNVSVEGISLSTYSVTLRVGERKMPLVTMSPENASDKREIWTSSDEAVASVDGLGNITALSEGSCTVTVTSAQNRDVSAQVEVTVLPGAQITYIDGILVVNKSYALPADYAPGVNADAQAAFDKMQADAADEDINIYISSGYRSYDYQAGLYQRYVDRDGKAEADRYSARPGHSEHQTGLAFDLNTIDNSFADTKEGKWVLRNCYKYGFIIRYPADKEEITGYMWEPWHIRYLGEETAKAVHDSGLCLEEYLGITSCYAE